MQRISPSEMHVEISIRNISPVFIGFEIEKEYISFNLKSTLAQLGLNATSLSLEIDKPNLTASAKIQLHAYGKIATCLLDHLEKGRILANSLLLILGVECAIPIT